MLIRITLNAASIPEGSHMFERNKDRLSYSQGNIQFDLTQVKSPVSLETTSLTCSKCYRESDPALSP